MMDVIYPPHGLRITQIEGFKKGETTFLESFESFYSITDITHLYKIIFAKICLFL